MYILTNGEFYLGKDDRGRPSTVTVKEKASVFKTRVAAANYENCLPDMFRRMNWKITEPVDESELYDLTDFELRKYGNTTKTTTLENEDFDICGFFTEVIEVMSQLERFVSNMIDAEQIADMKILDVRHYIRNESHKLNAIQMQRLGYYLQELEKERYAYKSKRLIATMFVGNVEALKDRNNISKMNDIMTSKYRPRVLDDTDIECIINKKKTESFIA